MLTGGQLPIGFHLGPLLDLVGVFSVPTVFHVSSSSGPTEWSYSVGQQWAYSV